MFSHVSVILSGQGVGGGGGGRICHVLVLPMGGMSCPGPVGEGISGPGPTHEKGTLTS